MRTLVASAFAALLASAGAAFAEDVRFDPTVIETCLGTAPSVDCIGTGAAACSGGDFGGSNVGYGLCFGAELGWWDAELNRVYAALMDLYKTRDADLADLGSAVPPSAPALRAAQRAWIGWRDSYCTFVATTWGGGSGTGIAQTECLMRLTGQQALRLDALLAESGG